MNGATDLNSTLPGLAATLATIVHQHCPSSHLVPPQILDMVTPPPSSRIQTQGAEQHRNSLRIPLFSTEPGISSNTYGASSVLVTEAEAWAEEDDFFCDRRQLIVKARFWFFIFCSSASLYFWVWDVFNKSNPVTCSYFCFGFSGMVWTD